MDVVHLVLFQRVCVHLPLPSVLHLQSSFDVTSGTGTVIDQFSADKQCIVFPEQNHASAAETFLQPEEIGRIGDVH